MTPVLERVYWTLAGAALPVTAVSLAALTAYLIVGRRRAAARDAICRAALLLVVVLPLLGPVLRAAGVSWPLAGRRAAMESQPVAAAAPDSASNSESAPASDVAQAPASSPSTPSNLPVAPRSASADPSASTATRPPETSNGATGETGETGETNGSSPELNGQDDATSGRKSTAIEFTLPEMVIDPAKLLTEAAGAPSREAGESVEAAVAAPPLAVGRWNWRAVLAAAWLLGAMASGLYLLAGWLRLNWTVKRAYLPTAAQLPPAADWTSDQQPPAVLLSDRIRGPAVAGILRPVILLPSGLMESATPEELALALRHEAAHIRRGDPQLLAVRMVVRTLWWCHPLVWLLDRAARAASEVMCDNHVLQSASACDYAESLLSLAGKLPARGLSTGLTMFARGGPLELRVRRLLDERSDRRLRLPLSQRLLFGSMLAALGVMFAASGWQSAEAAPQLRTAQRPSPQAGEPRAPVKQTPASKALRQTSLGFVPQDTVFYASAMNHGELWRRFTNSLAFQGLKAIEGFDEVMADLEFPLQLVESDDEPPPPSPARGPLDFLRDDVQHMPAGPQSPLSAEAATPASTSYPAAPPAPAAVSPSADFPLQQPVAATPEPLPRPNDGQPPQRIAVPETQPSKPDSPPREPADEEPGQEVEQDQDDEPELIKIGGLEIDPQAIEADMRLIHKHWLSHDVFLYAAEFRQASQALEDVGAKIKAREEIKKQRGEDPNESFDFKLLSSLKIPAIVIGCQLRDDKAREAAERLAGYLKLAWPMLVKDLQSEAEDEAWMVADLRQEQVGADTFYTWSLPAKLLPWHLINRSEMTRDDEQKLDDFIATVIERRVTVAVGLREGHLLLSFGEGVKHLERFGSDEGLGPRLVDHPDLEPLRRLGNPLLAHVCFRPDDWSGHNDEPGWLAKLADYSQSVEIKEGMDASVLAMAKQVREDLIELDEDVREFAAPRGGTLLYQRLTRRGLEGARHTLAARPRAKHQQPLVFDHLGKQPLAFWAREGSLDRRRLRVGLKWGERLAWYLRRAAGVSGGGVYFEQYRQQFRPHTMAVTAILRDQVIPALGDGGSAIVLSAAAIDDRPHAALSAAFSLRDRNGMLRAGSELMDVGDSLLDAFYFLVRMQGETVEEEWPEKVPRPHQKPIGNATLYWYDLPEEMRAELPEWTPHWLVGQHWLVASTHSDVSQSLLKRSPLRLPASLRPARGEQLTEVAQIRVRGLQQHFAPLMREHYEQQVRAEAAAASKAPRPISANTSAGYSTDPAAQASSYQPSQGYGSPAAAAASSPRNTPDGDGPPAPVAAPSGGAPYGQVSESPNTATYRPRSPSTPTPTPRLNILLEPRDESETPSESEKAEGESGKAEAPEADAPLTPEQQQAVAAHLYLIRVLACLESYTQTQSRGAGRTVSRWELRIRDLGAKDVPVHLRQQD